MKLDHTQRLRTTLDHLPTPSSPPPRFLSVHFPCPSRCPHTNTNIHAHTYTHARKKKKKKTTNEKGGRAMPGKKKANRAGRQKPSSLEQSKKKKDEIMEYVVVKTACPTYFLDLSLYLTVFFLCFTFFFHQSDAYVTSARVLYTLASGR